MAHDHSAVKRLIVEDCLRFDIAALFRSRVVRFDGMTEGVRHGLTWRTYLSDRGSFIEMSGCRWALVPIERKNVSGVQWLVLGKGGRRYRHLLVAPDGRVGTRTELGARYKSQTMWTGKRLAHRRHKVIEKLSGPTSLAWVRDHPTYVPDRPKRMRRSTYRRLRKRLTTTPRKQPELDELRSVMGQLPLG
jgi:hypothetical protein